MRKIKMEAVPKNIWGDSDDVQPEEIVRFTKNKLIESYNVINETVNRAEVYKTIGYRTPEFESLPKFIRPLFKLAFKVFAKVTRYIIKDQNTFNEDIQASLKSLTEGQQYIIRAIEYMDDRLEKLTDTQGKDKRNEKEE
ncbi:hypothetical protein [Anaerobium acetethylicum]|nr:hypothetical protein [Anaerobium acetethylicum]